MTYKLVLLAGDVGDVHVVGGGREILKLLAGEDVGGDKMNLGVTVLASLGGRHVDDLAGAALDDDVTVLAQSRALHGEGGRGTGIGGVELELVLRRTRWSVTPLPYYGSHLWPSPLRGDKHLRCATTRHANPKRFHSQATGCSAAWSRVAGLLVP